MRKVFSPALAAFAVMLTWLTLSATALAGDEVISSGSFKGASSHVTSGDVTVRKSGSGVVVVFEDNFDFDGAPDPKVGFGNDGRYDGGSKISHLDKNKGRQVYEVPESIDPEAYNEIYVWCERYNVPLGIADLKP